MDQAESWSSKNSECCPKRAEQNKMELPGWEKEFCEFCVTKLFERALVLCRCRKRVSVEFMRLPFWFDRVSKVV